MHFLYEDMSTLPPVSLSHQKFLQASYCTAMLLAPGHRYVFAKWCSINFFFEFSIQKDCFDIYYFKTENKMYHNEHNYSEHDIIHDWKVVFWGINAGQLTVPAGYQPGAVCIIMFNFEYSLAFYMLQFEDIRLLVKTLFLALCHFLILIVPSFVKGLLFSFCEHFFLSYPCNFS